MPRIVAVIGTHSGLPDVTIDQHHAQAHGAAQHAATTGTADLGADVSITPANTYVDGPSVSLAAGTWLIIASCCIALDGQFQVTLKLWDGVTVQQSGGMSKSAAGGAGEGENVTLVAIVVLGGVTTMKVSGACSSGPNIARFKAAAPTNGAGNNSSSIRAYRIA